MSDIKTQSVPALERGLALLEMLTGSSNGLTVSDFVRRSGLPKSSVHCLVITLARCGYLRRCERTHRFVLDLKLLPMAKTALGQIELCEQAAPHLHALMRATQLTTHMAIFDQGESVLIGKVDAPGSCPIPTWAGKRMHTHCTALGKAMIANLDDEELEQHIRKHGLPRHNENTIASPRRLRLELDKIRNVQWAMNDEEYAIGLRCIATPIFDHLGKAFAALSVSGTVSQISADNCACLAERVKGTASAISIGLSARWKPPSPWLGAACAHSPCQ
jgi:DNA-binding IclR family transcriptional regulator